MDKAIYTIEQFKRDVDGTPCLWYLQSLKGEWPDRKIDYWNFNDCTSLGSNPAIVTREEPNTICHDMLWEVACNYKGFLFWIPVN